MSDFIFFPLALIAAIALVGAALSPVATRKPSGSVSYSAEETAAGWRTLTIEGDLLYKIVAGGDADIQLLSSQDGRTVLSIEAGAGLLPDDPVRGPHFRLASDVENVLSGKRITVKILAKPAEVRGASELLANYSTGRQGESGWQTLALMPDWTEVSFTYDVPVRGEELSVDYLAIRPAVPDKTRAVLIARIVITWEAR